MATANPQVGCAALDGPAMVHDGNAVLRMSCRRTISARLFPSASTSRRPAQSNSKRGVEDEAARMQLIRTQDAAGRTRAGRRCQAHASNRAVPAMTSRASRQCSLPSPSPCQPGSGVRTAPRTSDVRQDRGRCGPATCRDRIAASATKSSSPPTWPTLQDLAP